MCFGSLVISVLSLYWFWVSGAAYELGAGAPCAVVALSSPPTANAARGVAATRLPGVRSSLRALGRVARRVKDIVFIPRRCGTVGPLRLSQAPTAVNGFAGMECGSGLYVGGWGAYGRQGGLEAPPRPTGRQPFPISLGEGRRSKFAFFKASRPYYCQCTFLGRKPTRRRAVSYTHLTQPTSDLV